MCAKVAVVITHFLKDYVERVLRGFPRAQASEFEVYYYSDFRSLVPIYESLPKTTKAIVASGSFPARVLELSFPDSPMRIQAFNNDNAGIYRLFLELLNSDRALKLGRVFADILDVVRLSPDEFLFGSYDKNLSDITHESVSGMSPDELAAAEETYAAKHIALWQSGKIDVSVTRFSSIVERLKQAGLNVRFAYPDVSFVRNVLFSAFQDVTIDRLTENLTCSVIITVRHGKHIGHFSGDKFEALINRIGNHIGIFGAAMKLSYHLQKRADGFEIFTDKAAARIITEGFTVCKLRSFLSERIDTGFDIGYGIGFSLYQARINAVDAVSEAGTLPFDASCLKNERDELIAPLGSEKKLVISLNHSDLVKRLAKDSGLSCLTIQKIISVANTLPAGNITSEELSYKLSITKRSANRFLHSLNNSGLAYRTGKKQNTSKGRPEYVYRLTLNPQ